MKDNNQTVADWEEEFDKRFGDFEYRYEATSVRIPINTREEVADLGTVIGLELKQDVKDFIKKVQAQTRQQTLDECLEIIKEREPNIEGVKEVVAINNGNVSFREVMDFEWMTVKYYNEAVEELRQAINSSKGK